jgi:hypothetical protein
MVDPQWIENLEFSLLSGLKYFPSVLEWAQISHHARDVHNKLACLKGPCFFVQIPVQLHCPNPSPKPFSQSRESVNLWPGTNLGLGTGKTDQGYKEEPWSAILCSCVCSAGVSTCLHHFVQKELPCEDFLSLVCLFSAQQNDLLHNFGIIP